MIRICLAAIALSSATTAQAAEYAQAVLTSDREIIAQPAAGDGATTLFEAGSISKFACTITVLRLADRGVLALDDTLGSLVPHLRRSAIAPVTLRQLLASRSGLADGLLPALKADRQAVLDTRGAAEALHRYGSAPLAYEPGTRWSYDVVDWIAVQLVIETVTGKPIDAVLQAEVLTPAGMGASRIFTGQIGEQGAKPVRAGPPLPDFLRCAGGLATTPGDLLALGRFAHKGALSPVAVGALTTVLTHEEGYTLGGRYRQQTIGGALRWLSWQSGSNGSFKSVLAYDPVSDTGFAAMTASGDATQIEAARKAWLP